MAISNKILLSFDVEEFDLPLEYKQVVSVEEQLSVGYEGLQALYPLLELPIRTTLFTTAFFAEAHSDDIKMLSAKHEIASHTYYHTRFMEEDLGASKEKLESITGQRVYGLRMPRMKPVDPGLVKEAGYIYNSSVNPTWLPGRYNHLNVPRLLHYEEGCIQFPVSVTPKRRIPLFWLLFKNIPYSIYLKLVLQTLRNDGYVCLYFHPWEFTDLTRYKLPFYVKRHSGNILLQRLRRLINDLSEEGEFISMADFIALKNNHQ
jgi:peptidoglycan/xylan/chitin deacetylase (PgdA/CDA1 family)